MSPKTFFYLLLYAAGLYLVRFYGIGLIEQFTLFEAMHQPMVDQAACFGFTMADLPMSHLFNYLLWVGVVLVFHLAHPALQLKILPASLLLFGLGALFFISISGIFMNHFNADIRVFFRYLMLDALLVFSILAVLNGLCYPLIFRLPRNP